MEPTIGRIVHYRLSEKDIEEIAIRREAGLPTNTYAVGDVVPLIVVRPWHQPGKYVKGEGVLNGQILMDGPWSLWALSVKEGDGPGTWSWPPRG